MRIFRLLLLPVLFLSCSLAGLPTALTAAGEEAAPRLPPTPRFKTDPRKILGGEELPAERPAPSGPGLAVRYPQDRGIEDDPDVIFATGFEPEDWLSAWSYAQVEPHSYRTIAAAPGLGFEPLVGKALEVVLFKGHSMALNMLYKFKQETGEEPEEVYFRYYLRLGRDWQPSVQGGKFPGIAGTYDKAGWGGRRSDGFNGWSMRGSFGLIGRQGAPAGHTPVGTYAYHAHLAGTYGEHWPWSLAGSGALARERWYCIEQYVKMNSLRWDDGVMRVWIDGALALNERTVRYRHVERLKIDRIWMNIYHGGRAKSPRDMHLFIDNVVVARRYIGPMAER